MRPRYLALVLACGLLLVGQPGETRAQEEATPIVYASYFQCDISLGQRVSEIVRETWAPLVGPRIASGTLTAWGMITHQTGGQWTRALYHVGTDRATMMGTLDEMVGEWLTASPEAAGEFFSACPTHEDYIWMYKTGSSPLGDVAQQRPAAGLSTYWVCDEGRGPLADLLVENVFAPFYDAQIEAGLLSSWGWYAHFVGGEYRRLLVMNGADHETLLQARDAVIASIQNEASGLGAEFTNVCNGHTDYLWNVEISEP